MLNKYAIAAMVATMVAGPIHAQQTTTREPMLVQSRARVLTTLPASATTITNYYKQNVYDPANAKIGEIKDVLVGNDGKVDAFGVRHG